MKIKQRNRRIIFVAAAIVLIVAAVYGGVATTRVYARSQAQISARQYLSAEAEFVSYHDANSTYTFRFFDAGQQERSEVEVDKSSGKVKKIQSQKSAYIYPDTTAMSEEELKEIVRMETPDAAINDVILHEKTDEKYVSISYTSEDCRGVYLLDPANGSVIARTVKYGRPVVIPSSSSDNIGLLTLSALKTKANQKIPGAVFQDLDIVYDDGRFAAQIDLYMNGTKYILVLDACSGEELAFDYFEDDWNGYGSWDPKELETPLLDIVNLSASLELSKSATASDADALTSGNSAISETKPASEETTSPVPSGTTETQPTVTTTLTSTPKPAAATTPPATTSQAPKVTAAADSGVIGLERAKSLVLSRLPGAVFDRIDLDEDDGRFLYKGKVISGTTEVDFEMDAYTGTFAKWDVDTDE